MPAFRATDGTELAYHRAGTGRPLVCLRAARCAIPPTWATSAACRPGGR
jgi:hypothetical protein